MFIKLYFCLKFGLTVANGHEYKQIKITSNSTITIISSDKSTGILLLTLDKYTKTIHTSTKQTHLHCFLEQTQQRLYTTGLHADTCATSYALADTMLFET